MIKLMFPLCSVTVEDMASYTFDAYVYQRKWMLNKLSWHLKELKFDNLSVKCGMHVEKDFANLGPVYKVLT